MVVKPPNARCDTRWRGGNVTRVNSPWNIEVDGVPRHLQDIRLARPGSGEQEAERGVPPPVIVVEDQQQDQLPVARNDTLSTIPSGSWEETVSRQSDEEGWRSLPYADEESFSELNEEAVNKKVQVAEVQVAEVQVPAVQQQEAAEAEDLAVRRSTRVRKAPERYGEWVEDWSED